MSPMTNLIMFDSPTESGPRLITETTSCDCIMTKLEGGNLQPPSPSCQSVGSDDSGHAACNGSETNSPFSQSPTQGRPNQRPESKLHFRAIPPPPSHRRPACLDILGVRSAPVSRSASRPNTPKTEIDDLEKTLRMSSFLGGSDQLSNSDSETSSPQTPVVRIPPTTIMDTPIPSDRIPPLIVYNPPLSADPVKEFDNYSLRS